MKNMPLQYNIKTYKSAIGNLQFCGLLCRDNTSETGG